jgi:hypothetical protein
MKLDVSPILAGRVEVTKVTATRMAWCQVDSLNDRTARPLPAALSS